MIILRATINGFGKWTDATFDFSKRNLICFYGENESGKSTLQQFILYMLFGLPPRKRKEFQPKLRSEIGGTLTVKDNTLGIITVSRMEDDFECRLENGEMHDEVWWRAQLSGLNRDIYTSIYAFSAIDLGHIRSMKAEELSDVLFSVGLTGSMTIYEVEKKLTAQLEALYKKQGRKPYINEQINDTATTYQHLQVEKEKEAAYHSLVDQLVKVEDELQTQQDQIRFTQKEMLALEKTIQMLPVIHQLYNQERLLAEFPVTIPFPEDGLGRLHAVKELLLPLKSELRFIGQTLEKNNETHEKLVDELLDASIIQEAEAILHEKAAFEQRTYVLQENERKHAELETQLARLLYELEWEENNTKEISLPFHLETSWGELQEIHKDLQLEKQNLQEEQLLTDEKKNRLKEEEMEIHEAILPPKQAQQLEGKLQRDSHLFEGRSQAQQWKRWEEKRYKSSKFILLGTSVLAVLFLVIAFTNSEPLLYIIPVLLLLIGVSQTLYTRNSLNVFQSMSGNSNDDPVLSQKEREEYQEVLQKEQQNQAHLLRITNELKRIDYDRLHWDEKYQLYTQKEGNFRNRMETERHHYPFLQELEVAHWIELLKMIRVLQKTGHQIEQLDKEQQQLQAQNNEIQQRLQTFSKGKTFKELQEILEVQQTNRNLLIQNEEEIASYQEKRDETADQVHSYQQELTELFHYANVADEEAFYTVAHQLDEKKGLQESINQTNHQLNTIFTTEKVEQLMKSRPQLMELEAEKLEMTTKQQLLEEQVNSNNKELVQLQFDIAQLEGSDDSSTLAYRYQIEKDRLNELAKRWSTLKIAQAALKKAKQSYQEKYLSEVITWTTTFFGQLTSGTYLNVFAPTETNLFEVEGKDNIRYTVEELSQGTIDQLYVSLRFAIAKVMSDTFHIPLLVDDAFVHFDDIRTKQVILLMKDIAEEDQQILFFTCKQATADLMEAEPVKALEIG